jgi:hypothetical protein
MCLGSEVFVDTLVGFGMFSSRHSRQFRISVYSCRLSGDTLPELDNSDGISLDFVTSVAVVRCVRERSG